MGDVSRFLGPHAAHDAKEPSMLKVGTMQGTGHPPESPPDGKTEARVDLAVQTLLGALGFTLTPTRHLGLRLPFLGPQQAKLPMDWAMAMFPLK